MTAKIYQAKGNFTSAQKAAFNIITFVVLLLLGLNYFQAFKELAMVAKGRLLTWASTNEDKILIERIDSLLNVFRLWRTTASRALATFCAAWILLNIVAQIAVGLTQLTYTVNDGTSYNDTYTVHGNVNVTDLSCYHMEYIQKGCASEVTAQTVAHSYGEVNVGFESRPYNDIADVLNSKHNYRFYHRPIEGRRQYAYRFNEYNPEDKERVYPFFTNRTITAESVNCFTYNETGSDGKEPNNFTYTNGTHNGTVAIPNVYLGLLGTTYMYLGHNTPASAPLYSCGPRCVWMWAYKNPGSPEPSAFYQCAVNISLVSNSSLRQHSIPDHVAKNAAASIAVHGTWIGTGKDQNHRSFQFYASGSAWEIHYKNADLVGENFAKFALGSIATMATLNPSIQIPGHVPYLGHRLQIYEPYFWILVSCIVGVHFALLAATVLWLRNGDKDTTGGGKEVLNAVSSRPSQ